jgi:hypothetical protein
VAWLDAALHREILRLRARYELSIDELRGLYVSDEQVDSIVKQKVNEGDIDQIDTFGMTLAALLAGARSEKAALWHLAQRFELADVDVLAVVLCLAPEWKLSYQSVFAYLNDDVARRLPSVDLCQRLADERLDPDSPAISSGLLEVHRHESAPLWLSAGLVLAAPVRNFLMSGWTPPATQTPDCPALTVISARLHQDGLAEAAAWGVRRGSTLVQLDPAVKDSDERLRLGVLTARLRNDVLRVDGDEVGIDQEAPPAVVRRRCRQLAEVSVAVVLSVPPDIADQLPLEGIDHERVDVQPLDAGERARTWCDELHRLGAEAPPADIDEVAALFRLTAAQIRTAATSVVRAGTPALATLIGAARSAGGCGLVAAAQRVRAQYAWDDLVLPAGTVQRLRELASAIRYRDAVFGNWRFDHLVGGHTSVRALFSGPSGTGKTMAASVLGRELGLEVLRVDLSSAVSKYIGETEKNLDRMMTFAERSNAIILFDEADALFGKRTEVRDSHDRYANIETAFLLQRLEAFDGVAILVSNLPGNLDEAFARRLHFQIEFPPPDDAALRVLWQRAFPDDAPLADDVDPDFLAAMFPLTGGEVRAASLLAAFLAAHDGSPIGMRHVVRALARLRRQQGKLPSSSEFKGYLRAVYDEDG